MLLWNPDTLPDSERPDWHGYKVLANLFAKYPFDQLSPAETCSSSGYELVADDGTVLSYVPAGAGHFHNSTGMTEEQTARIICLHIYTGQRKERTLRIVNGWIEIENPWEPEPFVIIFEPDSTMKHRA